MQALRRLGGGTKPASERWKSAKKKKADKTAADEGEREGSGAAAKGDLDRLTSLADTLLSVGEFGIYEDTFESIKYRISQEETHGGLLHIMTACGRGVWACLSRWAMWPCKPSVSSSGCVRNSNNSVVLCWGFM